MVLTVRILFFFFLVQAVLTVQQLRDITEAALDSDNAEDHAVGIQKRSYVKGVIDGAPKILKGTGKVVTVARIWWRVQQAKRILLKDASLILTPTSFLKVYLKKSGIERADRDFIEMSLYDKKTVQTIRGDTAREGRIGKYSVLYRRENPINKQSFPPSIFMKMPPSPDAREKAILIFYQPKNMKLDKAELSVIRFLDPHFFSL